MTAHSAVRGQNRSTLPAPRHSDGASLHLRSPYRPDRPALGHRADRGRNRRRQRSRRPRRSTLSVPAPTQPFVPVDCTVFSTELMESQLFGHVKGAFTGAVAAALGFVRCADGGTLFLDEIGELPLFVQAKLLRTIQERTVVPVGGVEPIPVDLRIIAATHRDLAAMVRDGNFRQDLYFRLNVVRLSIEPLRERRDEILPLAQHFVHELRPPMPNCRNRSRRPRPMRLSATIGPAMSASCATPSSGRFCSAATARSMSAHLPSEIREFDAAAAAAAASVRVDEPRRLNPIRSRSLADAERLLIARVLKVTGGNQSDAARLLDIERHRLRRKIVLHGLEHLARIRPR